MKEVIIFYRELMIKRNSSKEAVRKYISDYKGKEEITCECYNCEKVFTKTKRNIQGNLRVDDFKICCTLKCSIAYKNKKEGRNVDVTCACCGKEFIKHKSQVRAGRNNFCSSSCAAKINNLGRKVEEKSILKLKESLLKYNQEKSKIKYRQCEWCSQEYLSYRPSILYCSTKCAEQSGSSLTKALNNIDGPKISKGYSCWVKFENCRECKKLIVIHDKKQSKYCSKECSYEYRSKRQSERLKLAENRINLGRHKLSYMESSFSTWLNSLGIDYRFEPQFKNKEICKYYYPDFVFDDRMLIIELDGNQHEKTKEADTIRDEYIQRVYGYNVVRIKHKEYVKKLRFQEICDLLGICVL